MTYVTDDELEGMQSLIDAGEPLSVDEAQHLIAEVWRLRAALEEALKGRLLVPLVDVERDIYHMSTRVTVELPCSEFDECRDRQEFRKNLSERLNALGDTFLSAWDQLHGESWDQLHGETT